ncbi:hypothetical protein TIFTF001_029478 [Ficus carica]|uniref:Uncharacterized protein n=1 Tax=Ficus carica TaxID=3494 RepID=A0AA88J2W5_FICCA|nr:hypothetical protein TIFTF001_029478 [Ficus carica]
MIIEDSFEFKKPKKKKLNRKRRRLRKQYQVSDSDDEEYSQRKSAANGSSAVLVLSSDDEDKMPMSSRLKVVVTAKEGKQEGEEIAATGIDEGDLKPMRYKSYLSGSLMCLLIISCCVPSDVGHKDGGTPNKKRKDQSPKVDSNGLGSMEEDGEKQK